jgi:hypothetical protein
MPDTPTTAEDRRLAEDARRERNRKRWGPYLADRQWGTVREHYSPGGTAWSYFPHDHAFSRTYRWGEDGLLGITDRVADLQADRRARPRLPLPRLPEDAAELHLVGEPQGQRGEQPLRRRLPRPRQRRRVRPLAAAARRDFLTFAEYFCGDSGRGIGARYQGWAALAIRCFEDVARTRE